VGERREPKAGDTAEQTTGLDPITGLGRGVAALVIGKSAGERESVARALHRAHHGADGAFLRIQGPQEEQLFRQAIESWLAPPTGGSPRLLDRLQQGSLFLDQVEALGSDSQKLLLVFLDRNEDGSEAWKGQLITGSERSLHGAVKEGRFDENLALRLERVRIVLDPEQAGPDR
jgi:DNA-binding NtrC family response regulator